MRWAILAWAVLGALAAHAMGHEIPNARVDRAIQVTVAPGRVRVDYEVGLAELTLVRDLRALAGALPGGDRLAWFAEYGRITAPLNRKGLIVAADGEPVGLREKGFDLKVEEHPR